MRNIVNFIKISVMTALLIIVPISSYGASENPLMMEDKANIVTIESEDQINELTDRVNFQTVSPIYVLTVDGKMGETNSDVDKVLANLSNMNAITIVYYAGDKAIDIQSGTKAGEILTPEVIKSINTNEKVTMLMEAANPGDALLYTSTLVADKVLVANGFESIIALQDAQKENSLENTVFYIVIAVIILGVLFITPISPYYKRKKVLSSTDEFPPTPNGVGPFPPLTGGHK